MQTNLSAEFQIRSGRRRERSRYDTSRHIHVHVLFTIAVRSLLSAMRKRAMIVTLGRFQEVAGEHRNTKVRRGGEPREEPLNHCTMWRAMDQPMEIVLANRRVEAVDVRVARPLLPVRVFVRFFAAAQIFHMYDIDTIQDGPDHNVQTVDNRGVLTGKEPPVSKWPLSQRLLCLFRW